MTKRVDKKRVDKKLVTRRVGGRLVLAPRTLPGENLRKRERVPLVLSFARTLAASAMRAHAELASTPDVATGE